MATSDDVQRFSATSGRIYGGLAVATAMIAVVLILLTEGEPSYVAVTLVVFLGAVAWVSLLRPRLDLGAETLVMHNMLSTDTLPLTAIESVAVRQVLVVRAGDKRYTSAAVGRTRRQLVKDGRPGGTGGGSSQGGLGGLLPALPEPAHADSTSVSYGRFVEERIRSHVADALAREGIRAGSAEQRAAADAVTRRPAAAEIAVLVSSLTAFVILAIF